MGDEWHKNGRKHIYVHTWANNIVSFGIWVLLFVQIMKSEVRMWRAPKFFVDPLEGPSMRQWNLEPLPSSQHLEG
jgi:hypothetical protein